MWSPLVAFLVLGVSDSLFSSLLYDKNSSQFAEGGLIGVSGLE